MRRMLRLLMAGLVLAATFIGWSLPVAADNAPFWESPVGLTPGHPDHQVRMVAESVDVRVVERGDGVYAAVDATFDMLNHGPDIRMKVGFPNWTDAVVADLPDAGAGPDRPYSPVVFTPAGLAGFRVRTDDAEYRASEEEVRVGPYGGSRWFLWEMPYPSLQPVRVYVSYEQKLGDPRETGQPFVQPMYVLRTGALWDGTIGEATVTMTAPDGGAFLGGPELFAAREDTGETTTTPSRGAVLGAEMAAEASPTRLVWRLRDFEPSQDVGATYIVADAWRALRDGEAAVASGSASGDEHARAARAALRVIGEQGPNRVPLAIVARYPDRAREWAHRSVALAPDNAASWEAVGDMERWFAMPARRHRGDLACWPAVAADAYQRAVDLGSPTAGGRLRDLFALSDDRSDYLPDIAPCTGAPDETTAVLEVRRAVKAGNRAWAGGVGPRGTSEEFPRYFADAWLRLLTDEVGALRGSGQYRSADLRELTFRSVSLTAPDAAVAETTEVWEDRTYRADGSLARDASGRLAQRYELRLRDGAWKVVDASLVRETPPRQF